MEYQEVTVQLDHRLPLFLDPDKPLESEPRFSATVAWSLHVNKDEAGQIWVIPDQVGPTRLTMDALTGGGQNLHEEVPISIVAPPPPPPPPAATTFGATFGTPVPK